MIGEKMKKITLKQIKELLKNTLFLKYFINVSFDNNSLDEETFQRITVTMSKYMARIVINHNIKSAYINIYGEVDLFDAKEWIEIRKAIEKIINGVKNA